MKEQTLIKAKGFR